MLLGLELLLHHIVDPPAGRRFGLGPLLLETLELLLALLDDLLLLLLADLDLPDLAGGLVPLELESCFWRKRKKRLVKIIMINNGNENERYQI